MFQQNRFVKLPFTDTKGRDVSAYIGNIFPVGKHLLVLRDNTLVNIEERYVLYLYDKETKKIIAQTQNEVFYAANLLRFFKI